MHLPPIVCSLQEDGTSDRVAILPTDSMYCDILREMQRNPPEVEQNVSLMFHYPRRISCAACPDNCAAGDILVPGIFGDPKIFVQFDGCAHHNLQVGGTGAGLF